MQPPLEISQYFIDELQVKVNQEYEGNGTHSGTLDVDFDIRKAPDGPRFLITMTIDANKTEKAFSGAPYRVFLALSGFFEFAEGTDKETIDRLIGPNGLSILYGIARGTVAQATACCRHSKFILPAYNFMALLDQKAQQAARAKKSSTKRKKPEA